MKVKIKAVPGRIVLMPERGMKAVPAEGVVVQLTPYYSTKIAHQDVELVENEKAAPAPAAKPAPAPKPAPVTA